MISFRSQALSLEDIALASLICDDTMTPVEPDGGSQLLQRKEIIRLTNAQAAEMFPEAGGVDCNMYMTQQVMPHKLVFRSGWNPGDMYMLVECYPRHDPLNPTAILSLERYSAAFAEMSSEKFVSRENAVRIDDLSGEATYLGQKTFRGEKKLPLGWAGMQSPFRPLPIMGWPRTPKFVSRGIWDTKRPGPGVPVRQEPLRLGPGRNRCSSDRFHARVGPVWNIAARRRRARGELAERLVLRVLLPASPPVRCAALRLGDLLRAAGRTHAELDAGGVPSADVRGAKNRHGGGASDGWRVIPGAGGAMAGSGGRSWRRTQARRFADGSTACGDTSLRQAIARLGSGGDREFDFPVLAGGVEPREDDADGRTAVGRRERDVPSRQERSSWRHAQRSLCCDARCLGRNHNRFGSRGSS